MWFILSILAALGWATTNQLDTIFVRKYLKKNNPAIQAVFQSALAPLFLLIFWLISPNVLDIGTLDKTILIITGIMYVVGIVPYYYAIKRSDATVVVPLFQLMTVFLLIFDKIIFNDPITEIKVVAFILIFIGSFGININFRAKRPSIDFVTIILMLITTLLLALQIELFKSIVKESNFWTTLFWQQAGYFLSFVIILMFFSGARTTFIKVIQTYKFEAISINSLNQIINTGAVISYNYAITLIATATASIVVGTQPIFVFILGIIGTMLIPKLLKEDISKFSLIQRTLFSSITFIGVILVSI